MRALLVALLLVVPATSASVAGDPPGPTCGITVCAEAGSAYETACVETLEGEVAVLTCTFSATSFFGGHSPWMLPGRVFLSGDATARWTCTQGCAPGQVERNVNAAAWWRGGPSVPALDLGSADGGHVPILTQQAVLRAPAGSGACCTTTSNWRPPPSPRAPPWWASPPWCTRRCTTAPGPSWTRSCAWREGGRAEASSQ
jgi:hypothetical protein